VTIKDTSQSLASIPPHISFRKTMDVLLWILNGYAAVKDVFESVSDLLDLVADPLLPAFEVEEVILASRVHQLSYLSRDAFDVAQALSVLRGRIDQRVFQDISDLLSGYWRTTREEKNQVVAFPAGAILSVLHQVTHALT